MGKITQRRAEPFHSKCYLGCSSFDGEVISVGMITAVALVVVIVVMVVVVVIVVVIVIVVIVIVQQWL